jgi:D-alanyl-D-alanine dipeptidase
MRIWPLLCLSATLGLSSAAGAGEAVLPGGYVHLDAIAPSIVQDMRYATARNFTGAPLPGYDAPRCILRRPAAEALAKVQEALAKDGLSLKVYDCYRPQRAVLAMHAWVGAGTDAASDHSPYMPKVRRRDAIKSGYIAKKSSHANGTAVDLTIVRTDATEPSAPTDRPCTAGPDDGSLDMGTAFDCFDAKSTTESADITPEQMQWRRRLVHEMQRQGFENYRREWWHFTFPGIARRGESADFPVEAATAP